MESTFLVLPRACEFSIFSCFLVANGMLFTPPHKAVILSEAPRGSIA